MPGLDNQAVKAGCAVLACGFVAAVAAGCGGSRVVRSPACSTAVAVARALGRTGGSTFSVQAPPFAAASVGGFSFVTIGGFTGLDELEVFRDEGLRIQPLRLIALPLSGAAGEALTPDGRRLLIAAGRGLIVVDVRGAETLSGRAVLGALEAPAGSSPAEELSRTSAIEVAVTRKADYAFVSLEYAGLVAVFNLRAAEASDWKRSGFVGFVPIGIVNVGLALSPDDHTLYVTRSFPYLQGRRTPRPGTLVLVNVARAEHHPRTAVEARVAAGCGPLRVVATPDGKTVWVTAGDSDELLAFSAAALARQPHQALIRDVPVGEHPVGLVLIDGGKRIIVMNSNRFNVSQATATLSLVDGTNGKLLGTIQSGLFPREGTVEANGRILLVTDYASQQLQTLQLEKLP